MIGAFYKEMIRKQDGGWGGMSILFLMESQKKFNRNKFKIIGMMKCEFSKVSDFNNPFLTPAET